MTVAEIAYHWVFDSSFFIRSFKNIEGSRPASTTGRGRLANESGRGYLTESPRVL